MQLCKTNTLSNTPLRYLLPASSTHAYGRLLNNGFRRTSLKQSVLSFGQLRVLTGASFSVQFGGHGGTTTACVSSPVKPKNQVVSATSGSPAFCAGILPEAGEHSGASGVRCKSELTDASPIRHSEVE